MSFEGRTSYAKRHVYQWLNQRQSTAPIPGMAFSFRFIGNSRMEVRSIFSSASVRLSSTAGSAPTNWTYPLEDPIGNSNQIGGWALVDSNGTLNERWCPPVSWGWIRNRYYIRTGFNQVDSGGTMNPNNRYSMMEW